MMKIFEIEKLIADFYEGKTSVAQEKELMHFFETQEVPPHLLADKELFQKIYNSCNEIEVPPHLEQKLSTFIDSLEKKEKTIKPHQERKINWHWISGIAAGLFLILSIGLYTHIEQQEPVLTDTYSNPKDAYKEAQKALLLVSINLNKGVSKLESAQKDMNKVNKILDERISE
ncbi:hypothetical protein [uncultured Bacteroides sp.]|uniref:hypothetical protein n=1 Tax=uncultured Bacteroides sp. TaxID=162156 RepID=UPI002AAAD615|nr:hypothetical protein [uncultured Bacteroides sp.]